MDDISQFAFLLLSLIWAGPESLSPIAACLRFTFGFEILSCLFSDADGSPAASEKSIGWALKNPPLMDVLT